MLRFFQLALDGPAEAGRAGRGMRPTFVTDDLNLEDQKDARSDIPCITGSGGLKIQRLDQTFSSTSSKDVCVSQNRAVQCQHIPEIAFM